MEYLAKILSSSKYFRILRITYSTLEISICTTCLHLYFLGSAGSAVACGGGTGLEKVGSRGKNTKYPWPHTGAFLLLHPPAPGGPCELVPDAVLSVFCAVSAPGATRESARVCSGLRIGASFPRGIGNFFLS